MHCSHVVTNAHATRDNVFTWVAQFNEFDNNSSEIPSSGANNIARCIAKCNDADARPAITEDCSGCAVSWKSVFVMKDEHHAQCDWVVNMYYRVYVCVCACTCVFVCLCVCACTCVCVCVCVNNVEQMSKRKCNYFKPTMLKLSETHICLFFSSKVLSQHAFQQNPPDDCASLIVYWERGLLSWEIFINWVWIMIVFVTCVVLLRESRCDNIGSVTAIID